MCGGDGAQLLGVVVAILILSLAGAAMAVDGEEEVASGAKALDSWTNYPWYDESNDSVRPVRLRTQRPPTQSTTFRRGAEDRLGIGSDGF